MGELGPSGFVGETGVAAMTSVVIGVSPIGGAGTSLSLPFASRLMDSLTELRGIEARLPLTRRPIAPVREGPRIVVEYLRFAPGKPECRLRIAGADSSSEGVGMSTASSPPGSLSEAELGSPLSHSLRFLAGWEVPDLRGDASPEPVVSPPEAKVELRGRLDTLDVSPSGVPEAGMERGEGIGWLRVAWEG